MHDGGKHFKERDESIFDQLGFQKHETYPTAVHQYLSPNDNYLHGCKSAWKKDYYNVQYAVEAPLRLMQLLDLDTVKHSKEYFERNLFHVTKQRVAELIKDWIFGVIFTIFCFVGALLFLGLGIGSIFGVVRSGKKDTKGAE